MTRMRAETRRIRILDETETLLVQALKLKLPKRVPQRCKLQQMRKRLNLQRSLLSPGLWRLPKPEPHFQKH